MAIATATKTPDSKRALPAPSVDYIMALKSRADSEGAAVRQHWQDIAELRAGTYTVPVPDKFAGKITHKIRTMRCADVLRRVKSTVTRNFPVVTCPPSGASTTQQDLSTRKEEFLNATLMTLDSANQPERTFDAGMDYSCAYGMAWWKLLYTPDMWAGEPTAKSVFKRPPAKLTSAELDDLKVRRAEYKQQRLPFAWVAPDPQTVWGFYQDRKLVEVIEVTQRTVADVERRYRVQLSSNGAGVRPESLGQPFATNQAPTGGTQTIEFIEHWDDTWVTYIAGTTIVGQWRHKYERVPYFPFLGLSNYTSQPGARGESVIAHVIDLEKELDALLSMKHHWAMLTAYAMLLMEADDPNAAPYVPEGAGEGQLGPGPQLQFEAGVAKVQPPGWHAKWMEAPAVGRDINEQILYLDRMLSQVVPDVMKGVASGPDQPGYAIYQLATAARLVYDPLCANAGVALEAMFEFLQWLIEHRVGESVSVLAETAKGDVTTRKWLTLGPQDLKGYYTVRAKLAALLPSNRQMEVQMGLSMYQAGVITWQNFLQEYAHNEAPEKEIRAKLREIATMTPDSPLFQEAMKVAMREAGLDRLLEQKQEEAALAGVPPLPGVAEEMAMDQQAAMDQQLQQGAAGQVEVPGMQTIPPPGGPPMPGTAGAAPGVGVGGLPAGSQRAPSTQMAPGGGLG